MAFRIQTGSHTHPGRIRDMNEDAVFTYVRPPEMGDGLALLIVADGIGGQKAGDVASKIAIEAIFEGLTWFLEQDQREETRPLNNDKPTSPIAPPRKDHHIEKRLRHAIQSANKKIHQYAQANPEAAGNLGTTVTCVLIWSEYAVIANVGDSRTYRLRAGLLEQLTDDHSFVGQLVREGQLPPDAYYTHPRRNVITRALGQHSEVKIDICTEWLLEGDKFLLCSDGLWEMVRDEEIARYLESISDPQTASAKLVALANAHGGADNIGVVIGEILPA